ncbi:hypothetical protein [Metapseudomonas otitidis]|uniref:hypothetical protein n=1 Tax=Metapseudomonas otitidis TaxID=319939 RepID=UPI002447DFE8|nr:hypothetical protein [Pseudomonas otitidis]MDH0337655.1 hypothetical protein [Pseudomonas otitidis]
MARQEIPLGTAPTGEGGDNARQAFERVNQMTAELYGRVEGLESDPRLSDPREWTAATVPQAEAEAGTGTTRRAWTVQRVWQAIAAWWAASPMKTKLDGIAANATANATDAQLRDRSSHTGTQLAATISDLPAAVRSVTLAGLASSSAAITSSDTVLSALGKAMGSFANALPRPTTTDGVTLFADTAAVSGWYEKLLGGPYNARQADHPDGAIPAGTYDEVNYYWVLNITYAGNVLQAAFPYVSAAGNGRERIKFRLKGGSTWTAWQPLTAGSLTRSSIDVTAGRILKAGDGGWMGELPVIAGTNMDDRTLRGWRYWSSVFGHVGTPPAGVTAGMLITHGINGNYVFQELTELIQDSGIARKWRRNCYASLPWSSWNLDLGGDTLESILSPNIIINGTFSINQRNVPASVTLSAGQFGYDRWKAGSAGCSYTTSTVGNINYLNITAGSVLQLIGLANQQTGTHILSWSGTALGRIDGGSYSASPIIFNCNANSNLSIEFANGTVSMVQVQKGSQVMPYKHRPYMLELLDCQRFYQTGISEFCGAITSGNTYYVRTQLKVPMRAVPSIILANGYANGFPAVAGSPGPANDSFTEARVANTTAPVGAFASSYYANAEL